MLKKGPIISGFASSQLIGGVIAVAFINTEGPSLKSQLIKQGYKEIKPSNFGSKAILLKQYYPDLQSKTDNLGLEKWCEKQAKIKETDKESEHFKEFCFESVASQIEKGAVMAILKDDEFDVSYWPKSLAILNNDFKTSSNKPSAHWTQTDKPEEFKKQCKKNERTPYIKEEDQIFQEVKKYCTRLIGSDSLGLG